MPTAITLLVVNGLDEQERALGGGGGWQSWRDRSRPDHVKALFLDSITDPRAMQRIAGETGRRE